MIIVLGILSNCDVQSKPLFAFAQWTLAGYYVTRSQTPSGNFNVKDVNGFLHSSLSCNIKVLKPRILQGNHFQHHSLSNVLDLTLLLLVSAVPSECSQLGHVCQFVKCLSETMRANTYFI